MIFSKKFRKTAASVLALVMVFAMSTGAFAAGALTDAGDETLTGGYYTVRVNYEVVNDLPADAQISIIALAGQDSVQFDGTNTATNVLWIDQQAATAKTGSFEFQVDAEDAGEGFYVKSGVTGGETISGYVTIATQEPGPSLSSDATLSAISVNGIAATITGETATATVAAAVTKDQITATAAAGAKYVVNTTADANVFEIVVTAEDGTTTKTYTLTVTVSGGSTGGDGDAPVIPENGFTVNSGVGSSAQSAPLGVENGKVVRLSGLENLPVDEDTGVPTKTPYIKGEKAYYTSYDVDGDGEPEINFVTVISSEEAITSADVEWRDEEAEQLIYGDYSGDGALTASDANSVLISSVNKALLTTMKAKLVADYDGDGAVTASDANSALIASVNKALIPGSATK